MKLIGSATLLLALLQLGSQLVAGGNDAKDENKPKKFEIPKAAIAGRMKSINFKESRFTIIVKETGQERAFAVDKETRFLGPRGGISEERLKDDRLDPGYDVHVLSDKTGDVAREVYLPFRKPPAKKDKKQGKAL